MFLCGVLTANKYNDDMRLSNENFSKICGVNTQELMLMEIQFLHDIEFTLNVSMSLFISYLNQLLSSLDIN